MIKKIVSGGQTGVDRAALDSAIAQNIPHGGWCPKGRKAEDGIISSHYQLTETPTVEYEERTKLNVRDSDGTLILVKVPPIGGTLLTIEEAMKINKPLLVFDISKEKNIKIIVDWIKKHDIKILNIAGPRESQTNGIYDCSKNLLLELLTAIRDLKKHSSTLFSKL